MSVSVSGLALKGKTRALPQVSVWPDCPGSTSKGKDLVMDVRMLQAMRQDTAFNAQQKAAKALSAAKLKAVDGILWGHKQSWKAGEHLTLCRSENHMQHA